MNTLRNDLRYAARRLLKSPGFTLIAVLTLGLGIGANTAIFSVVNAVLLRPLPFPDADRLVMVFNERGDSRVPVSGPNFLDFRDQTQLFSSSAAYDANRRYNLVGVGDPMLMRGSAISAEFFSVLGIAPALGRGFNPEENEPGGGNVVILSHGTWQQHFGSDPEVMGRTITLDGVAHTIVGVMPATFDFPRSSTLWTPLVYDGGFRNDGNRGWHSLGMVARLQPGVTAERAATEMRVLGDRLATEFSELANSSATAVPMQEVIVGDLRPALLVLLGAVALVLLIACANVANLLLARAAAREGELAVRAALGAGRGRLIRQLLTESVLLGLIGGVLGVLLAFWGTDLLMMMQPGELPRFEEVRVDGVVIAFALGISLLTGILFGLIPALQVTRTDLTASLKEGGRGSLSGRRGNRARAALVVAEMALALTLLAGAGLLIRSFVGLIQVDPGFRPAGVLAVNLTLPSSSYPDEATRRAFYSRLIERLEGSAGVASVSAVSGLPMGGRAMMVGYYRTDRERPREGEMAVAHVRSATPEYFRTLGIPLLRGRSFTPADRAGAPFTMLLSEAAAERLFPGEEAIGQRLALTMGTESQPEQFTGEVVGIVGNVHQEGLDAEIRPEIYLPFEQAPFGGMDVTLRTAGAPLAMAGAVREAVREIDPNLPVGDSHRGSGGGSISRGAALLHAAPDHLRRRRAGAGGRGDLRGHLLRRAAAHPRDRDPAGTWRLRRGRAAPDDHAGDARGAAGARIGSGADAGTAPGGGGDAVRSGAGRPAHPDRCRAAARGRRIAGELDSRAPRHAGGSDGGTPR